MPVSKRAGVWKTWAGVCVVGGLTVIWVGNSVMSSFRGNSPGAHHAVQDDMEYLIQQNAENGQRIQQLQHDLIVQQDAAKTAETQQSDPVWMLNSKFNVTRADALEAYERMIDARKYEIYFNIESDRKLSRWTQEAEISIRYDQIIQRWEAIDEPSIGMGTTEEDWNATKLTLIDVVALNELIEDLANGKVPEPVDVRPSDIDTMYAFADELRQAAGEGRRLREMQQFLASPQTSPSEPTASVPSADSVPEHVSSPVAPDDPTIFDNVSGFFHQGEQ
ncbi:MAG: hypothetical protein AAGD25_10160 [Cyanobacteria bacterium P01_F01_bin.150]